MMRKIVDAIKGFFSSVIAVEAEKIARYHDEIKKALDRGHYSRADELLRRVLKGGNLNDQ